MTMDTLSAARARLGHIELQDPERLRRLNDLYREVQRLLAAEDAERARYGAAAAKVEAALCCPVSYDRTSLAHIPERILKIDYGCGDPTVFAEPGMTVLDLGSGSGKHVFMIAKKVGSNGRVIGIDKTPEMLALSRGAIAEVTKALGYSAPNARFLRGHIDNLAIDLDALTAWLAAHPVASYEDLDALDRALAAAPMVASNSIDLVVSNCVLNLVQDDRKRKLLSELYRVVARNGSIAISDIVADRPIPAAMKADQELWTGCISGAWQRHEFTAEIAAAGFHGVMEVASNFWQRVGDINFHSVTVRAWKGKAGPCYETYRGALYKGPFAKVEDDDRHVYERGVFVPVCEKTAELLSRAPYAPHFQVTQALADPNERIPFDCGPCGTARPFIPGTHESSNSAAEPSGGSCSGSSCC